MLYLAWRQLISRKKQSVLILIGISFGTLLFVSISGVQLGMRNYISQVLLNNTAHVLISGAERKIDSNEMTNVFSEDGEIIKWFNIPSGLREEVRLENYGNWYNLLAGDSRVFDFSPRLKTFVVLSKDKFSSAVNLIGTIPEKTVRISSIENYMKEGSFLNLKGSGGIIIGSGAAEDMGLKINQYLNIVLGNGERRSFRLVGIYHFGNDQADRSLAFASLNDVQVLTKSPGRISEIAVALFDIDESSKVASEWRRFSRDKVQDWQEANQSFMEMIKVQDYSRYFITITILIVASFGIYNVLSIMINQKKKEIAILQAIGYAPMKILQLVLYQGIFLGVSGGFLGLLLGYLICLYLENLKLNIEIGGQNHLWISYDWKIYFFAILSAFFSSVVSSIIPAYSASKLMPMDIIRAE
jgi:lipoprotein-releasing system permease protein